MSSNYRNRSSKKKGGGTDNRGDSPIVSKADQTPTEKMAGYTRERRHPSGKMWERIVANVISHYGGICHLCGLGHPLALQADHLVPYAEGGDDSLANLRPAHGSAGKQKNPCPVCGLNCNNIRGALSVAAGKAKIERRMKAQGITPQVNEPRDTGRDW